MEAAKLAGEFSTPILIHVLFYAFISLASDVARADRWSRWLISRSLAGLYNIQEFPLSYLAKEAEFHDCKKLKETNQNPPSSTESTRRMLSATDERGQKRFVPRGGGETDLTGFVRLSQCW